MKTLRLDDWDLDVIREEVQTRLDLVRSGDLTGYGHTKEDEIEYLEGLLAKLK